MPLASLAVLLRAAKARYAGFSAGGSSRTRTASHELAGTRRGKSLEAGSRRVSVRDTLTDGRTLSFENGSHLVAEAPISHGE